MAGVKPARRAAAARAAADAEAALRLPRSRQRLDAGLVAVLAGLVAAGAAGGFGLAGWIAASGRFEPPVLAAVEDPRILTDYRHNPSPMVDLVAAGHDLLIGRQDGSIDRFDMAGRTFAAEALPRDRRLTTDLARLSVDCGVADCAGGEVFALTEGGGLAQRRGTGWEVVLGDAAFVGSGAGRSSRPMSTAGRRRTPAIWCWSMQGRRGSASSTSGTEAGGPARRWPTRGWGRFTPTGPSGWRGRAACTGSRRMRGWPARGLPCRAPRARSSISRPIRRAGCWRGGAGPARTAGPAACRSCGWTRAAGRGRCWPRPRRCPT